MLYPLIVLIGAACAALTVVLFKQKNTLTAARAASAAALGRAQAVEAKLHEAEAGLRTAKEALRETTYELKEAKKKNWQAKNAKPAPRADAECAPPAPQIDAAPQIEALARELREAKFAFTRLESERDAAQRGLADSEHQLARVRGELASARGQDQAAIEDLRAEMGATIAKLREETRELGDLRRRNEEYRRIYVVQRGELAVLKDKLAHVRQRYLDLCAEQIQLLRALPQAIAQQSPLMSREGAQEIERLKKEEADYQATQAKLADGESQIAG